MTREEIKNTPELVDYLLDESVIADSRKKLHKRMDEICNLAIKALEQEPKTGHWIEEIDDYGEVIGWHCDKCYEDSGFTTDCKWNYCPNCGCRMVEPQERSEG